MNKARRKIITVLLFSFLSGIYNSGLTQCLENVDFSSWSERGNPLGNWEVFDDTVAIVDGDAVPPTFFISPNEFLNVKISGRMII